MTDVERRSIISGVGQSDVGRRLGRSGLDLTLDAALEAIADAGLTPADIDGIATYPGAGGGAGAGFSGPGTPEVQDALRLEVNWHTGGIEGAAQLAAVVNAVLAVSAGLARHVLVYRTVTESTEQGSGGRQGIGIGGGAGGGGGGGAPRMSGVMQWSIPFRAYSAANWLAMIAHRHFHEYGTTPEQMAMIAVNGRRNAGLNPKAVYRDPMTLDDYFASRMVTSPFRLYDCDAPVDGSTAVVVSVADHATAVDHPVARVEAVGTALRGRPSWDQFDDMTTMAARDAGAQLWTRTDLKPADVDVAELYDGFSFLAMVWLEALGFCGKGESGPFVEGGHRIALDGELPLNTHGGQLSAGRLHGFGFIHEACLQLRGEAGDRQVGAAVEVAAVANGGGPIAGALLLTREG
jgi:acetyl-CoA acetyltransferase